MTNSLWQSVFVAAHNDIGVELFQQGKFDQAIEHFKQTLQIAPNDIHVKNNLNVILAEKQKSQSAENIKK